MAVYSDLQLSNPTARPLAQDLEALYQAVIALLNTKKGERLFNPTVGNSLEDSLFELVDDATALEVRRRIIEDVNSQIPIVQVNLGQTRVTADPINGVFKLVLVLDVFGLSSDSLTFVGDLSSSAA